MTDRTLPDDLDTILREIFLDGEPKSQREGMRVVLDEVRGLGPFVEQFTQPRVSYWDGSKHTNPDYTTARLYVAVPESRVPSVQRAPRDSLYYDLTLDYPDRRGLWISRYDDDSDSNSALAVPVSRSEQIAEMLAAILVLPDSRESPELQTLKIAKLSQIALTSNLNEHGQEHAFAYSIGHNSRNAFLSFRIGTRKRPNHVVMPVDKLERVANDAPQLIDALEFLAELGISFQADNERWSNQQCDWIKP